MKQKGEVLILLIGFMFIIGLISSEARDQVMALKCKTDNPDVKCEIYRE